MSTPDARLNAAERAALADLEAAAAAADPSLSARLRGRSVWRARPVLSKLERGARRLWSVLLRGRWWGLPLTVAGLLLMTLGLSSGLVLSVVGAAMALVGLLLVAEAVRVRLATRSAAARPD